MAHIATNKINVYGFCNIANMLFWFGLSLNKYTNVNEYKEYSRKKRYVLYCILFNAAIAIAYPLSFVYSSKGFKNSEFGKLGGQFYFNEICVLIFVVCRVHPNIIDEIIHVFEDIEKQIDISTKATDKKKMIILLTNFTLVVAALIIDCFHVRTNRDLSWIPLICTYIIRFQIHMYIFFFLYLVALFDTRLNALADFVSEGFKSNTDINTITTKTALEIPFFISDFSSSVNHAKCELQCRTRLVQKLHNNLRICAQKLEDAVNGPVILLIIMLEFGMFLATNQIINNYANEDKINTFMNLPFDIRMKQFLMYVINLSMFSRFSQKFNDADSRLIKSITKIANTDKELCSLALSVTISTQAKFTAFRIFTLTRSHILSISVTVLTFSLLWRQIQIDRNTN